LKKKFSTLDAVLNFRENQTMPQKTRGSAALDKAQRRLGQIKSIDENLDLGFGLTVTAYDQLIDETRTSLEAHNTLLSNIAESRQRLDQLNASLSDLSERMLRGVAIRYGKNSIEYIKAGGSNRRRGGRRSTSLVTLAEVTPTNETTQTNTNGATSNGKQLTMS
jgi:hypothetical protein